jgi:hypothetical protein
VKTAGGSEIMRVGAALTIEDGVSARGNGLARCDLFSLMHR